MRRKRRKLLACLMLLLVAIATWAAWMPGKLVAQTTQPDTTPIEPTGFGAIGYFQQKCATCHGNLGSQYLPDLNIRLDDAGLREVLTVMAAGPANAPLEPGPIEQLLAFHRTLQSPMPYVEVTRAGPASLAGEASPGSEVAVNGEPVKLEAFQYSATEVQYPARVTATRAGETVTVTVKVGSGGGK